MRSGHLPGHFSIGRVAELVVQRQSMQHHASGESLAAAVGALVWTIAFRLILRQVKAACLRILHLADFGDIDAGSVKVIWIVGEEICVHRIGQSPARGAFNRNPEIPRKGAGLGATGDFRDLEKARLAQQTAIIKIAWLERVGQLSIGGLKSQSC